MMTEQAIGAVVFLILLAIALAGLFVSSRNSEKLDTTRHGRPGLVDPTPGQKF